MYGIHARSLVGLRM